MVVSQGRCVSDMTAGPLSIIRIHANNAFGCDMNDNPRN